MISISKNYNKKKSNLNELIQYNDIKKKSGNYKEVNNIFTLLEDYIEEEIQDIYQKKKKKLENKNMKNIFNQKYVIDKSKLLNINKNLLKEKKILCITENYNDYKLIDFVLKNYFTGKFTIIYNNDVEENNNNKKYDIIFLDSMIFFKSCNKYSNIQIENCIIIGNILSQCINLGIKYYITKPFDIGKIKLYVSKIINNNKNYL